MVVKLIVWKCLFLTIFLSDPNPQSGREPDSGIYLVISNSKKCENKLTNINKTLKVCVTPEPIISIQDFASVSDVKKKDVDVSYFLLVFSNDGYQKIKKLYTTLPHAELVLVANNTVIGYITNLDIIRNRSLQVEGEDKYIETIHEKFKGVLNEQYPR